MIFGFIAFLLFAGAFYAVGYYVWMVPHQQAATDLEVRLQGVRSTVRESKARGSAGGSDLLQRERRGSFAVLGDFIGWLGIFSRLQMYIQQANLKYRAADVAGISVGIAVFAYLLLSFFVGVVMLRLVLSLLLGSLPIMFIVRQRNARLAKFEVQLPDAIDLFTRTMRAGHNIHSGLETIAEETSDPVRMEFKKVIEELALGSSIEAALHKIGERMPLIDLKFFITGLILQRQTGANMVTVLENLSLLVRERLNMAAKLKAHTTQQRFSAGLLCGLPFVVGLGFWFLKPEYMRLLWTDPLGIKFFTYAIISEIIGILVIRQMAKVKA